MVFEDLQTCFIHIPKCGGTSVTSQYLMSRKIRNFFGKTWRTGLEVQFNRAIGRNGDRQILHNMHADADQYYPVFREYDMVTQVRNPYDRFASAYKHLHSIELVDTPFVEWVPRAIESLYTGNWSASLDAGHQYIQHLHIVNPGFDASILFKHQYSYLRPEVEVHKLEEGTIWERLGIKRGFHNVSQKHYETEYSIQNSILVRDYYERDFEELGY
jgi:hypothetical protein|tara:strand:- start:12652 stop:13296 length:645 start_codon:yes stop_codon:yes gene_type:complete